MFPHRANLDGPEPVNMSKPPHDPVSCCCFWTDLVRKGCHTGTYRYFGEAWPSYVREESGPSEVQPSCKNSRKSPEDTTHGN